MHKYLRAIGLSNYKTRKEVNDLLRFVVANAEDRMYTTNGEEALFSEYRKEFAEGVGIAVRGEYDEENRFTMDYYFPYCIGHEISSTEDINVERHAACESYAGVCDDVKMGVSLIFYLQNVVPYLKIKNSDQLPVKGTSLVLSALSLAGTVMMPIQKNEADRKKTKKASFNRNQLIDAARRGDEEAIESLTLEDMDMYSAISRKILKEDVFTLVDTYFMPYGVECDQYSILGEITGLQAITNKMTKEEMYLMTVFCNEISFDVCINKMDLLGEPEVGRRFKGIIWLQGFINFPE